MKRFIFIIFFILAFSTSAYAQEDTNAQEVGAVTPADLETTHFYKSPMGMMLPEERTEREVIYSFDYNGPTYKELDPNNMPLFKQLRVKVTNKLSAWTVDSQDELQVKPEKINNQDKNNKRKFGFKNKKTSNNNENNSLVLDEGSIADSIHNQLQPEVDAENSISFESGISEQVVEKELQLDAENVNYDEETGDMIATGRPELFFPSQKTKIIADKMIFNQETNLLKGIGNVVVIRNGMPTTSDYLELDMSEETAYMDNLEMKNNIINMDAKKGIQENGMLIFTDGNLHSETSHIYRMSSRMIGPRFSNMVVNDEDRSLFLSAPEGNKFQFKIDRIYVDARKNHDKFVAKKIKISKDGKYWFSWPSFTAYSNKEHDYFEANYPEFGTRRKLGMFIGPGFVFGGPGDSVMKVIPFLNYQKSKFGFGGALKYKSKYNNTELGYGSSADVFFLRGVQRLDDNVFLQYSANSYMDEWFFGSRMPKYMAEIYYDKKYRIKDFLAEGRGLTYRHRLGLGLMKDDDTNHYGERINGHNTTTARLRYMAEVAQSLYSFEIPEQRFYLDLSVAMQGSAAVYGTGDTQFVGRLGPRVHVQYKNWMQDCGYFQSAYSDGTPVPRYDMYRYGRSAFYLSEIVRLNKYISVGWSGMVNLSNDSPNGKLFQENRFVVALGPDDLKIRLGYDFVRQTTYFGFDLAFDTKGTNVSYGRMEIKNPERFGKKTKEEEQRLAFSPAKKQEPVKNVALRKSKNDIQKAKPLEYAKVIPIEDPDRETVD